ncbi:sterol desaturase family protein [Polaribacter aquimarinus]|uniref:C-5 sterol desaturase n=1 Tax=Polaribacter aquimarinus TaxID=2100726 RepID=A0A2U2J7L1_9FLAO|nr:sterol desaturase family protein [Polaribacter aquimarinus]PWG04314.1 C-5 sterol desaturase [Polaribacter aquimarinus]
MQIPEFPNLIHYAIPFFVITVILEIVLTVKVKMTEYEFKDAGTSIIMGLGNVTIGLFTKGIVLGVFLFFYEYRFLTIPFTWWAWVLVLFAEDLTYYWAHRIGHLSRFFWASHVVHHSSQKYNLSTALRQTWTGGFYTFIFWIPLILIGFHPIMVLVQMSISLIYQYWIHTEFISKLPKWIEAIFNTPSHHRVHHATNPQYLDRNFAGVFIIWDKFFDSFEPEIEKPSYGLVKNIETYNPLKIAFLEWYFMFKDFFTSKTSMIKKIKYFIKPPGWKHDDSGMVSKDLRAKWEKNKKVNI